MIAAEPALEVRMSPEQFDTALVAVATFVDLKSPYMLGHARAVSDLVADAGAKVGLAGDGLTSLRRAGLVHGLGRLGVSNSIWDKRGTLGAGEWERVRMQPYLTERMLHQSAALAPLSLIAVQLRERLDGSGYPRCLSGGAISQPARILGAADAYQAMCEPRPHRPAFSSAEAAVQLRAEVKAGRMDGDAVEAVLAAAGHRVPRRREGEPVSRRARSTCSAWSPAGCPTRDRDATRHLSQDCSEPIEHIYVKIGASNRTAASLFAMRHGLLPDERSATI